MNLELTGKLIKRLPLQKGEGKNGTWQKIDFVIETTTEYPKNICFSVWGDTCKYINAVKKDDIITVAFNPESREYNEKWYTDLRAWSIKKVDIQEQTEKEENKDISQNENDLPF